MILKINNERFDFFEKFSITLSYNSVASKFSFSAFFDPANKQHKRLLRPFQYARVQVLSDEDELLLTGTVLNNAYKVAAIPTLTPLTGYSLPGVLEDCQIPLDVYPLQFDNLTLSEIAQKIVSPFGVKTVIDPSVSSEVNSIYDTTNAKETQTVKQFLTELATQKNVILSHDQFGRLLFTRAKTNVAPVASFDEGQPSVEMNLSTAGQGMHNEITLQKEADIESENAGESSASNPYVSAFRPKVKTQNSGDDNDSALAARNELNSELRNIKLTIKTDRWEWIKRGRKEIIKPNNIISVYAPGLFLNRRTNFFVESVTLSGDATSRTASLSCVLPEVYNEETPKNIFR